MRGILSRPFVLRATLLSFVLALLGGPVPVNGINPIASFAFAPPVPIAARGTLSNGSPVTLTVTARDSGGNPIPGATVWLQFFATSATTTPGSAMACGKVLGTSKSCVADGSGNVTIDYVAATPPSPSATTTPRATP